MRSTFLLPGGTLSAIVGLVGILNFANAIITDISARRRELAILRSVGMTARQLRTMLMLEGLLYTLGAVMLALLLTILTAPAMNAVLGNLFWFLSYRFTFWPVLAAFPVFAILGVLIPAFSGRMEAKHSIVERLRQEQHGSPSPLHAAQYKKPRSHSGSGAPACRKSLFSRLSKFSELHKSSENLGF